MGGDLPEPRDVRVARDPVGAPRAGREPRCARGPGSRLFRRARAEPAHGRRAPPGRARAQRGRPQSSSRPVAALARAYRRALRRPGILDYGEPFGEERLRVAIGAMLRSTRGLDPNPASLIITRGSQFALALVARALVRPGDMVVVEELGYPRRGGLPAAERGSRRCRSTRTGSGWTRSRRSSGASGCARSTSRRSTSTPPPSPSRPGGASRSSGSRRPSGLSWWRTTTTAISTMTAARCCARATIRPASSCTWGPVQDSRARAPHRDAAAPAEAARCLAEHRRYADGQGDLVRWSSLSPSSSRTARSRQSTSGACGGLQRVRDVLAEASARSRDAFEFTVPGEAGPWCQPPGHRRRPPGDAAREGGAIFQRGATRVR